MAGYHSPIPRHLNATAAFCGELRDLRDEAGGRPTVDEISQRTGVPRSTIYGSLKGTRLPSVKTLRVMVEAWGGDLGEWLKKRSRILERR